MSNYPLLWNYRPESLRAPALVCALKGWSDAGDAASRAGAFLINELEAKRFALLDSEQFCSYQVSRPEIRLVEGVLEELKWPEIALYEVRVPGASRDLIVLVGEEPSYQWRLFCNVIKSVVESLDIQLVVSLGAFLADIAHTQITPITAVASDPALIEHLNSFPPSYEGFTGIVGVLHSVLSEATVPVVSMWGAVPPYIAAVPNPRVSLALVRHLEKIVGVNINAAKLEISAREFDQQVTLAVDADPQMKQFVKRLIDVAGEYIAEADGEIPSGDVLERDFQRFLRQRGERGDDGQVDL